MTEREMFEEWRSQQSYPDNKMIDGVQWEAWQARAEIAQEREKVLVEFINQFIDFATNENIGDCHYMESSYFYNDLNDMVTAAKQALNQFNQGEAK